eukprot:CAMPEP_0184485640 /NCGR_PEP_ID=MMETSP0113_2-20130426/7228_1 /TAXON_ID=91329 /ORGANISM="Norrisiella sphaerica, Strain BC52" /LENGTH=114 /DNA_ID=CAMNT_0026867179 /DNA_START=89 /DNA_END=433 /DNA_ORIENTATION=-
MTLFPLIDRISGTNFTPHGSKDTGKVTENSVNFRNDSTQTGCRARTFAKSCDSNKWNKVWGKPTAYSMSGGSGHFFSDTWSKKKTQTKRFPTPTGPLGDSLGRGIFGESSSWSP